MMDMERPAHDMVRIQLIQQYYSYLRLMKMTANFQLSAGIYNSGLIDFTQFSQITLIGMLQEIKIEPIDSGQMSCLVGIVQTTLTQQQICNPSQLELREKKRIQYLREEEEKQRIIRREKRRAQRQLDIRRRRQQEWMREGLTEEQKQFKRKQLQTQIQSQSQGQSTQVKCQSQSQIPTMNSKKTKGKTPGVMRKMVIPMKVYKAYICAFNKIMQSTQVMGKGKGKLQHSPLHAFTNLIPRILNKQIIFTCTSKTYLLQLDRNLIQRVIQPMERSLLFSYSRIQIDHLGNIINAVQSNVLQSNIGPSAVRKYQTNSPLVGKEDTPTKQMTKELSEVMLSPHSKSQIGCPSSSGLTTILSTTLEQGGNNFNPNRVPILQDLKLKLAEVRRICIMGVIKSITMNTDAVSKRDRQIQVQLIEDCPHANPWEIGICKILIRYPLADQQNLLRCMQVGKIHLFIDPQIYLSDNVVILYKMRIWHKHIIKMSNLIYNPNQILQKLITILKPSPISLLYMPHIFRNLIKIRATFQWIRIVHAKVLCQRCNQVIYSSESESESEPECINGCKNIIGKLSMWTAIGVSDQFGVAQLSLEDHLFFKFFGIEQHEDEFKLQVMKEDSGRKGVKLYWSPPNKSGEYATEKIIKNPYFQKIISTLLHSYRQVDVIGIPRYNMNESFNALAQDKKQEFLSSYVHPAQYMRNQKVNLNGYIQTNRKGELKYVPLIKVTHIM